MDHLQEGLRAQEDSDVSHVFNSASLRSRQPVHYFRPPLYLTWLIATALSWSPAPLSPHCSPFSSSSQRGHVAPHRHPSRPQRLREKASSSPFLEISASSISPGQHLLNLDTWHEVAPSPSLRPSLSFPDPSGSVHLDSSNLGSSSTGTLLQSSLHSEGSGLSS